MKLAQLTTQQFERFRDFIYVKSGIRIPDNKLTLLSNRIRRRLDAGSWPDFDAYYAFLTSPSGRGELEYFFDKTSYRTDTKPHPDASRAALSGLLAF